MTGLSTVPVPPGRRRALSLAGFTVLGLGAVAILLVAADTLDREVTRLGGLKSRFEALANREPDLRQRLDVLLASGDAQARGLVRAMGRAQGSAALRGHIAGRLAAFGGRDIRFRDVAREPAHGLARLGLQVSADLDHRGLQDFLQDLESADPLVFVEELMIRGLPSDGDPADGRIRTVMVVHAYRAPTGKVSPSVD